MAWCTSPSIAKESKIADTFFAVVLGARVTGHTLTIDSEKSRFAHAFDSIPSFILGAEFAGAIDDVLKGICADALKGSLIPFRSVRADRLKQALSIPLVVSLIASTYSLRVRRSIGLTVGDTGCS